VGKVAVKGVTIYHPGDSDFIPEMKGLKPDVALLPVSVIYVMTAEEAVEAAAAIQPKVAIHVGEGIGPGQALSALEIRLRFPWLLSRSKNREWEEAEDKP